jgi:hypothetical protein
LYWAAEVSGGQAHRGNSRVIVPVVHWHLACFANEGDEEPIYQPEGKPLHHSNFRRRVWLPAIRDTGLTGIHFHGLRHTSNTLAACCQGVDMREPSGGRGRHRQPETSRVRRPPLASGLLRLFSPKMPI